MFYPCVLARLASVCVATPAKISNFGSDLSSLCPMAVTLDSRVQLSPWVPTVVFNRAGYTIY